MKPDSCEKLLKNVEKSYEIIAEEFSATRNFGWSEFEIFKKYIPENAHVADIGCGNGRLRKSLPTEINYTGIDTNKTLLEKAKKEHLNDTFLEGNLLEIPTKETIFDVTFCIATLHHIPSPLLRKKAIQELVRITKKDGIIIITVWNLWQKKYWKNIFRAFKKWLSGGEYQWNDLMISWSGKVDRYYHAFTQSELKNLLKKEDFKIEKFFREGHNYVAICRKK
ncbi:MAG: methyltransferase domain-containing protein [Patescibacteria group bacterium]